MLCHLYMETGNWLGGTITEHISSIHNNIWFYYDTTF